MATPRRMVKANGEVTWKIEPCYKGKRLKAGRFPTKHQAQQYELDCIKEASREGGALDGYRLSHALDRFIEELGNGKRRVKGARWETVRAKKILKDPIADEFLSDLSDRNIDEWMDRRRGDGVAESTILREISLLQAVMRRCTKWRWLDHDPFRLVDRPKSPQSRDRRPSDQEIKSLLAELRLDPEDLHVFNHSSQVGVLFLLAIETGMRLSEMTTLEWDQVELGQRYLRLDRTKNGDRRTIPLSTRAVQLLGCLKDTHAQSATRCFTVTARNASALFYKARKKAGIEGLTFHDSRHEAASRLARKLEFAHFVSVMGWRNPQQAMVYVNPSATELAQQLD